MAISPTSSFGSGTSRAVEISVLHGGRVKVEPFAHSSYDLDGEGWALAGTEYGVILVLQQSGLAND